MRKQKEGEGGRAIGIDLTGELAKIHMTFWDKDLLSKLREVGIDPILCKRYVDDIVIIIKIIEEARQNKEAEEVNIERVRDRRRYI